jgi:hypothetical protein
MLVRRIGSSQDSSMFYLELFQQGGSEKRVADDCRPLLMLGRWESTQSQLFLRLEE